MTKASRIDERYSEISAGSVLCGPTLASDTGVTHMTSGSIGPRWDSWGGEEGPISMGRARRWTWRCMSMQTLVAIR